MPEFRESLRPPGPNPDGSPAPVSEAYITTGHDFPGFTITRVHGIVADIGASAGKTARGKAVASFQDALNGVRHSAGTKGANAIIGLQVANFGASAGGSFGDAVGSTLMGTAVTIVPDTN